MLDEFILHKEQLILPWTNNNDNKKLEFSLYYK